MHFGLLQARHLDPENGKNDTHFIQFHLPQHFSSFFRRAGNRAGDGNTERGDLPLGGLILLLVLLRYVLRALWGGAVGRAGGGAGDEGPGGGVGVAEEGGEGPEVGGRGGGEADGEGQGDSLSTGL